jgi:hypothetical protein
MVGDRFAGADEIAGSGADAIEGSNRRGDRHASPGTFPVNRLDCGLQTRESHEKIGNLTAAVDALFFEGLNSPASFSVDPSQCQE